jgi:Putative zinc- or iron-chelating domain
MRMNLSELVSSEYCMDCGKCCRSFTFFMDNSEGFFERASLLVGSELTVRQTNIGIPGWEIAVENSSACRHLEDRDGKNFCAIWNDDDKPYMCKHYPSNLFYIHDKRDVVSQRDEIKRILNYNADICPALKGVSVDDVLLTVKYPTD